MYTSSIRVRFSIQLRQQIFAKVPEWEVSISNSETKVPWEVVTKPSARLQTNGFLVTPKVPTPNVSGWMYPDPPFSGEIKSSLPLNKEGWNMYFSSLNSL